MGRKKKRPTKVLSGRIPKCEYDRAKRLARKTDKSILEAWRNIRKESS